MTTSCQLVSTRAAALKGAFTVPGDKSISHRALLLASQVLGTTSIDGLLEGEDVLNTAKALGNMGVSIKKQPSGRWTVDGVGIGGLSESTDVIDMGNSGTGARLLMGLVTPYPFSTLFTGDASLRKRPMKRVIAPLSQFGAKFVGRSEGRLPLALQGTENPLAINYTLPVASAQVKSAILLAALNTPGITTVVEPAATRDHTERMLNYFGIKVDVKGTTISIKGQQEPERKDRHIVIPGDPSSAAFPVVAALIVPGSDITITNICMNPLRTGLFTTLIEMGANIEFLNKRNVAGEDVADLRVRHSQLKGITVPADRAPSMIDEYPILSVAASVAKGETKMLGLAELKVKESNRLEVMATGLAACGVVCKVDGDNLIVTGGKAPKGGVMIATHLDHRIAMSFLVMGMISEKPATIDDGHTINTSFPRFVETMNKIGTDIAAQVSVKHRLGKKNYGRRVDDQQTSHVIAIDGPAASGKGTLARRLADYLDYTYLDTGGLYRAVGMKLIYSDRDPNNLQDAIDAAKEIELDDLANPRLRQERIGQAASVISAYPEVRQILLDFQRNFAKNSGGAVLDGRDIGTVVCPDADLKVFITADLKTRAERRHRELQGEGIKVDYNSVYEDLKERDERDQKRTIAPLAPAPDAVTIDTSKLDAETVFKQALGLFEKKF